MSAPRAIRARHGRAVDARRGADAPVPDAAVDQGAAQGRRRQRHPAQQHLPDDRPAPARRADRGGVDERAQASGPERTTYRITDTGRATLRDWLRHDALHAGPRVSRSSRPPWRSCPASARPDAVDALTTRIRPAGATTAAALDDELAQGSTFLLRLFLIESEYQRQVIAAELDYVRSLVDDLRGERITWP